MDIKEIGTILKNRRKAQGFKQTEAAGLLNIGVRFLSELENGKSTAQIGKVIEVAEGLGFELILIPKSEPKIIEQVKKIVHE